MMKEHIIIVSRDEEWLARTRRWLDDQTRDMTLTRSASSALELAGRERPDAAVIDAGDSTSEALTLGEELRALVPSPRVVIVTPLRGSWLERSARLAGITVLDFGCGPEAFQRNLNAALREAAPTSLHDWSRGSFTRNPSATSEGGSHFGDPFRNAG